MNGLLRCLDLTDEKGLLCGQILAELGIDVIKIEKPGGDEARNMAPFYHDTPHPEKSLFWFAFNRGKRAITLNLTAEDGKQIFRELIKTSDFLVESFPPGYMENLGLGYPALSRLNPRLIMTSITPFGQAGPYRDYKSSDLIISALSGVMYITGEPDRAPVRVSFPLTYPLSSTDAATGALIAHHHREQTGKGQHVDVSMQQCLYWHLINIRIFAEQQRIIQRKGALREGRAPGVNLRYIWPSKDGYVIFYLIGGSVARRVSRALAKWVESEEMASDFLKSIDWDTFDVGAADPETIRQIEEPIAAFFKAHTNEELYKGSMERGVLLCPLNTLEGVAKDEQLLARNYWQVVPHPELGTSISYPGPSIRSNIMTQPMLKRAPLIGEHNYDIYVRELGYSQEDVVRLKEMGVI